MEEFFRELEECLQGEVSDTELRDSMDYYRDYFKEERSHGKSEDEILRSLGSPRLIARSIIDAREAAEEQRQGRYYNGDFSEDHANNGQYADENDQEGEQGSSPVSKIAGVLLLVVILIVIGMVIRVLLPFILVVIAVILIGSLFQRRG